MPWYDGLDDEQRAVVSYSGSHSRILAGPGTGKTFVMARRVAYLVTEERVLPTSVLALTFTRHATAELRQRVIGLVEATPPPHVSTLHSFALRQLLRNADLVSADLPEPLRIADDFEERHIVIEDLKAMLGRTADETRGGLARLSADWETLSAESQDWERQFPDAPFLGAWQEHRNIYGYLLRAELVYRLKRALEQYPDFRVEGPPSHLLVDEYQDLNRCDLAVVKAIAQRGAQLFAAGDDDQSIYGFRFAHPEGIRRFRADYPDAGYLQLSLCRRCDPAILRLGLFVADQDYQRIPKPLHSEEGRDEGEVQLLSFRNQAEEATGVALLSRALIDQLGYFPHDILILVRFDRHAAYSSVLREALHAANVPVSVGEERDPFGVEPGGAVRPGRLLLALLHLAANLRDHLAWRTLLSIRHNNIGDGAISSVYQYARRNGLTFSEALNHIEQAPDDIQRFGPRIASEVVEIRAMAQQLAGDVEAAWNPLDAAAIAEGIERTAEIIIPEPEARQWVLNHVSQAAEVSEAEGIHGLLQALTSSSMDIEQHLQEGRLNVLTMHKAKGLTAKAVFVVAAEDELVPGTSETADAVGDERRLPYVSLTRAKHYLFITHCQRRTGRQAYTGRDSGRPERTLTRFLRDGPLSPVPGLTYAREFSAEGVTPHG